MMGKRQAALARMERVIERTKAKQVLIEQAISRIDQSCVEPAVDYALAYRERIKQLGDDGLKEEPRLRTLEAVVRLYCENNPNCTIDEGKAAVLSAIATKETTAS
jgi:hypothetical protein